MPSNVDIANLTLTKLGADTILSLDEDQENARKVKAVFVIVRDIMLAKHPWRFATKRVALSLVMDAPVFDFSNAFQIPADCLRVLITDDETQEYKIEKNKLLLTDRSTMQIKYIVRVEDPIQFSEGFVNAFVDELTFILAYPITSSRGLASDFKQLALASLKVAKAQDAQGSGSPDKLVVDTWIGARVGR